MNVAQAKQLSMKDLLAVLSCQPHHEAKGEIWYPSPFREQSKSSFKINLDRNIWYDFGEGEGGNILDLAMKNITQPICGGATPAFYAQYRHLVATGHHAGDGAKDRSAMSCAIPVPKECTRIKDIALMKRGSDSQAIAKRSIFVLWGLYTS